MFDLAEIVGPAGCLVGLDTSEVMIAEARRHASERRLAITFEVGQVQTLPFPDATFDVCRAARLLEHLPDARQALSEMIRVTREDGRVVVFDFDWDTLIIDHLDKETTRTIVRRPLTPEFGACQEEGERVGCLRQGALQNLPVPQHP